VFWLSVLPTLMATGQASLDPKEVVVFFAGFLVSALLWSVLMSSLIARGRRFVAPVFFRLVNLVCGLFLGFFALKLLWSTLLVLKG
jgi:threonine/homoserine/homoserine lactone efflux protein